MDNIETRAEDLALELRKCSYNPVQDIRPIMAGEDQKQVSYLETRYRQLWFQQYCKEKQLKGLIDDSEVKIFENLGIVVVTARIFVNGELAAASSASGNIIPRDFANNRTVVQRTATSAKGRALSNFGCGILETEYCDEIISETAKTAGSETWVRPEKNLPMVGNPHANEPAYRNPEDRTPAEEKAVAAPVEVGESENAASAPANKEVQKNVPQKECAASPMPEKTIANVSATEIFMSEDNTQELNCMPVITETEAFEPVIMDDSTPWNPGFADEEIAEMNIVAETAANKPVSIEPAQIPETQTEADSTIATDSKVTPAESSHHEDICRSGMTMEQALAYVLPISELRGKTVETALKEDRTTITKIWNASILHNEKYKDLKAALEIVLGPAAAE